MIESCAGRLQLLREMRNVPSGEIFGTDWPFTISAARFRPAHDLRYVSCNWVRRFQNHRLRLALRDQRKFEDLAHVAVCFFPSVAMTFQKYSLNQVR